MSTWFSKLYDPLMSPLEKKRLGIIRNRLVSQQRGVILEIGSGTGVNFGYYQQAAKVVAVEPDSGMRELSSNKTKKAKVPVELVAASGESLPFEDNTFDAAVGTLVLCTIPDPVRALQEIRRVCKPNAPLLFFEHVRVDRPLLGRFQDWLTPVWKQLCDGCHLNRNTLMLMEQSGIKIIDVEKHFYDIFLRIEAINQKGEIMKS
ncbi:class I SAM-dependent methyltransferase [Alteribacillus bidgolensis]|uniref:Methyltransferase domain-containing protein n=1 Tax=Alteribacillus bidgolensis TaxID=930129 RepID=A0A1G8R645_9BACI|nr:class I SAM-dependent methyltransferase [Alteribacillus bidgolensis]SDJ12429.1 Methyltransferase domain-containing protein [Alteribacillus bidgolensis]